LTEIGGIGGFGGLGVRPRNRKRRWEKDFPMPGSYRTWNRALKVSLGVHALFLAGGIFLVCSTKSAPIAQPATMKKGLGGDPLPLDATGDGSIFLAPRRFGPKHARFVTPVIYTEPIASAQASEQVRPVVAIQRLDPTAGLMAPKKLTYLASSPLDQGGNPSTGVGSGGSGDGGGNGSGKTKNFFSIAGEAKRIVFVLDASSSMGQSEAWHVARRELIAALADAKPDTRCKIVVYSGQPRLLLPSRIDWLDPSADRAAIADAIMQLSPEGRTEHGPALQTALALRPDAICFLTDADDLTQEHLRQVHLLNREGIPIHTIELTQRHRDRIGMPMQVLARRWGGVYQAIDLATWKQRTRGPE